MIAHGTYSKYVNHGCRCDDCRAAATRTIRQRREARHRYTAANGGLPNSVEHGNSAYVNWGCRCDTCKAAHTDYSRAYQ